MCDLIQTSRLSEHGLLLQKKIELNILNCFSIYTLPSVLAGSASVRLGEREGPGLGAAVTSLINGVGQVGGVVEGPVIGLLATTVGWQGVLLVLVTVSGLGALATYRADRTEQRYRDATTLAS